VSTIHPTQNTASTVGTGGATPGTPAPRLATRPVHPFSLSCAFDRQRGQFIVHAGARAGACAIVACGALALGTLAYVRSALFAGPSTAVAATDPRDAATLTATPSRGTAATEPVVSKSPSRTAKSMAKGSPKVAYKTSPAREPATATATASASPSHHEPAHESSTYGPSHHEPAAESEQPKAAATTVADQSKADAKAHGTYARRPGFTYLVVRNLSSKKLAAAARAELIERGVATTVERSLPGWPGKGRYTLVGMTGFDLDLASDRDLLEQNVKDLKALDLDPKPYKWRESAANTSEVASSR
jgi:hypothetical protein